MTLFQIILLGAAIFFAWQMFKFVQSLNEKGGNLPSEPDTIDEEPLNEPASLHPGAQNIDTLIDKADTAYGAGELNDARTYLERAEKQDPDNPEVLNKLGFIYFKQGDYATALEQYERSLELDPYDDLTHNAIAETLRKLGRLDEAQEHYKSAVDIDDSYEETYYNYGRLLIEKGDSEGAKMMFEKALELRPDYEEAKAALSAL